MGSQGSHQFSYVAPASPEIDAGRYFTVSESGPARIDSRLPSRFQAVVRDIISANRGRLSLLVCWDLFAVFLATSAGYLVSPRYDFEMTGHIGPYTVSSLLAVAFILSSLSVGLYERPNGEGRVNLAVRSSLAALVAWALVLFCAYAVTFAPIGRWIVGISAVILTGVTLSGRLILRYVLRRIPVNLLVLGDEQVARSIRLNVERRPYPPVQVLAVAPMACNEPLKLSTDTNSELNSADARHHINWIIVQGHCEGTALEELLPYFRTGTRICDVSTFFESFFQKVPAEIIDTNWLIQANVSLGMMANRTIKRAADVIGSLVGILFTLPLWPAIALGIKLSSKGPVFYVQERVGRYGSIFKILKFRTMSVDAEPPGRAVWAIQGDPRVTLFGRLLRKTRLDEIPQFVNVLWGNMSLVGPRPERPEFVDMLSQQVPHYQLRHLVRPGLTGWAQINYRYGASLDDAVEKLRYDLYYVKHGGLPLDLQIIIRTLGVLMRGSR
jgi:exopolysaccharide biosynthesis polyprenyl glycosylphosphotransferase